MKPLALTKEENKIVVAPRTGAWIETRIKNQESEDQEVAPRTGAWIETIEIGDLAIAELTSPPARGRGLKPFCYLLQLIIVQKVAPRTGAWIETILSAGTSAPAKCRPPHGGVD